MISPPSLEIVQLAQIALGAAEIVLSHFQCGVISREKQDRSPVTQADEDAEAYIIERLGELWPHIPVLAEEQHARGDRTSLGNSFFCVDALDGTKEFIRGEEHFTVNIGLIRDARAVAGVVAAPALGRIWVGDGQAFIAAAPNKGGELRSSAFSRIETREYPRSGLIAAASRSHRSSETDAFLAGLPIEHVVSCGSSLKFCYVAEGRADVYVRTEPTKEWDTAAGTAIVSAAGGQVVTSSGGQLEYGKMGADYQNPPFVAWGKVALKLC
jgi:3'(2'), 5'-bisphosphate nucleotidase